MSIKVLVSLSSSYPESVPPQLQLLSRYIGPYGADSVLFGSVLKTFISVNGVEWSPDLVCVFDGLQNVLDRCVGWYEDHLSTDQAGKLLREDEKDHTCNPIQVLDPAAVPQDTPVSISAEAYPLETISSSQGALALPAGVRIFEAEPITDRKSAFTGRACAITDPDQVRHSLN